MSLKAWVNFWPSSLFEYRGMRRVTGGLPPKFIVLQHGLNNRFLLIGNTLKLQTDVEIFRADVLMAPYHTNWQRQTRGIDPGQFGQLDGNAQLFVHFYRFVANHHCTNEIKISQIADQFAPADIEHLRVGHQIFAWKFAPVLHFYLGHSLLDLK